MLYRYRQPYRINKKQKTFMQIFMRILRRGSILQIINFKDHYQEEKKEVVSLLRRKLGGKIVKKMLH